MGKSEYLLKDKIRDVSLEEGEFYMSKKKINPESVQLPMEH